MPTVAEQPFGMVMGNGHGVEPRRQTDPAFYFVNHWVQCPPPFRSGRGCSLSVKQPDRSFSRNETPGRRLARHAPDTGSHCDAPALRDYTLKAEGVFLFVILHRRIPAISGLAAQASAIISALSSCICSMRLMAKAAKSMAGSGAKSVDNGV